MSGGMLAGPGYTLELPPGFTVAESAPAMGMYRLLPPGSLPYDRAAQVQIRAVPPFEIGSLLQNVYSFANPMIAQANAGGLGLVSITGFLPARQVALPQGVGHVLEFDGLTFMGLPVRVLEIVVVGQQASVELVVMMNLFRWAEFAGPCLSIIARLTLAGAPQTAASLQAVVDHSRQDQIEYRMVVGDERSIPLTALPTTVRGATVINYGTIVETGDINGTGIAIGSHTVSKVESQEESSHG